MCHFTIISFQNRIHLKLAVLEEGFSLSDVVERQTPLIQWLQVRLETTYW